MTTDPLRLTLEAMRRHPWRVVLLGRLKKFPTESPWPITREPDAVERHVKAGGNVGLVAGPESGVAVLDFDREDMRAEMFAALGALSPWSQGRPGRCHVFVRWCPGLPAVLRWRGERAGEVLRGPRVIGEVNLRQAVIPPSVHPDTLQPYRWLTDPRRAVPELPEAWARRLAAQDPVRLIPKVTRFPVGDAVSRARRYLDVAGPAIEGQGGDAKTFRLACALLQEFGLSDDEALDLLLEWNVTCEPPWTERELRRKVEYAAMRTAA